MFGASNLDEHVGFVIAELELEMDNEQRMSVGGVVGVVEVLKVRSFAS